MIVITCELEVETL